MNNDELRIKFQHYRTNNKHIPIRVISANTKISKTHLFRFQHGKVNLEHDMRIRLEKYLGGKREEN